LNRQPTRGTGNKERSWRVRPELAINAGIWTLVGTIYTAQSIVVYLEVGAPPQVAWAAWAALGDAYPWLLLTPILYRLARRFPWNRKNILTTLVAHAATVAACGMVYYSINAAMWWGYGRLSQDPSLRVRSFGAQLRYQMAYRVRSFYLPVMTVLAVSHAVHVSRRSKKREIDTVRLESQLNQAQLQNLKMQLHPHFLFNTLHTISALVDVDPRRAESMIARLSEMLRLSLSTAGDQRVRLRKELEMLEIYLDIQKLRYGDRLDVDLVIDPSTLDVMVPSLLLQPLAENAIKHGIANQEDQGQIRIASVIRDNLLSISVLNDGPAVPENGLEGLELGTGLTVTLERLTHMYGDNYLFTLENSPDGKVRTLVELPLETGYVEN
jgi:two-component sensor histidine kinase